MKGRRRETREEGEKRASRPPPPPLDAADLVLIEPRLHLLCPSVLPSFRFLPLPRLTVSLSLLAPLVATQFKKTKQASFWTVRRKELRRKKQGKKICLFSFFFKLEAFRVGFFFLDPLLSPFTGLRDQRLARLFFFQPRLLHLFKMITPLSGSLPSHRHFHSLRFLPSFFFFPPFPPHHHRLNSKTGRGGRPLQRPRALGEAL